MRSGLPHRVVGAILLAFALFPIHSVLRGRSIGVLGEDIVRNADRAYEILLLGAGIVITVAILASRVISWSTAQSWLQHGARALTKPSRIVFAACAAVLCTALTALFAVLVLEGRPNLIDAMVQLLHARFIAEGSLSAPADLLTSGWYMQNSVITDEGWVSHFPPGYPLLLGVGHVLGASWVIGAVLAGVAIFFTGLTAERLLPERKAVVRLGVLLAAQSPFFIGLAGAQMNHTGAAAFIAIAMYAAVRGATATGPQWALLSGAALGATFTIRPFAAIVAAIPAAIVAIGLHTNGNVKSAIGRMALGITGALPFGLAIAWYNARFFGSPLRFGYESSWGPTAGLGFHVDPWGNQYGPVEALGFTATDLTLLGQNLLESPVSVVAVVGLYLVAARRLEFGEKIIAAWALLPVVANFFYWHHGYFMGPRMLNEVAPAWCVLVALSVYGIIRSLPPDANVSGYFARTAAMAAAAVTLAAGTFYLAPERLLGYSEFVRSSRIAPPQAADSSIVFVHGAWTSRIVMRLAAAGMRLDSIETAMRHNPTCDVDAFSRAYPAQRRQKALALPKLDFNVAVPRRLPLEWVRDEYAFRPGPGPVRVTCARELHADRLGTLDVMPMLWQVRVPGLRSGGAMVVRDMGPEDNAAMIKAYPSLMPLMYYRPSPDAAPVLAPYSEAESRLWGTTDDYGIAQSGNGQS